jgi:beta-glucanase (GH16 family)
VSSRGLDLLALALVVTAGACGRADAQVGLVPADGGTTVVFSSEMAAADPAWEITTPLPRSAVSFVAAGGARDGRAVELRFPGDSNPTATDRSDPNLATMISTRQFFRYGTFRSRLEPARCTPNEEVVSAMFLYAKDGRDTNQNGLSDVQELDFQILCGRPSFIVLTAWSDYEDAADGGAANFRKRSHAIDTVSGDLYDTPSPTALEYEKSGNAPELVLTGFPAPGAFYDLGIDWQPARVRFFIVVGGVERTLWTIEDAAYIPQAPLPMMFNLWHPATHWLPTRDAADYPSEDAVLSVDSAEWRVP